MLSSSFRMHGLEKRRGVSDMWKARRGGPATDKAMISAASHQSVIREMMHVLGTASVYGLCRAWAVGCGIVVSC